MRQPPVTDTSNTTAPQDRVALGDRAQILVADDDAGVLQVLSLLLKDFGYQPRTARSPADALELLRTTHIDGVLLDMNFERDTTSGEEGITLLRQIRSRHPQVPVVMLTAWGDIDLAVRAVRLGAQDFITKPWDEDRLLATIASMTSQRRTLAPNIGADGDAPPQPLSPAMLEVLRLVDRVAPSTANILLLGEHGTGKDFTARLIHERSTRSAKALVTADLGGLAEGTFESELLVMSPVHSPMRKRPAWGASNWRTAERSFSTKSVIFLSRNRPGSCACCRRGSSSGSVHRARSVSTCG